MSAGSASAPTWFGHPRGLTVLFLTNMWEQFSYYGMRALLVYFMTKQLLFAQAQASFIYGAYTAAAYFTPILGGVLADRWLGKRRAIVIGASIMAAGHFMMAFDAWFYLALATIALGNGLFLPTLPSQVGDLYERGDARRGWAFNVYYVGINIGGFLAPLICGTVGELYGWHYGFGLAGIGMLLGLAIYVGGQRYLPPEVMPEVMPDKSAAAPTPQGLGRETILVLTGIGVAVTVFRAAYEQVGNTVALWADSGVDRALGGWTIPMTWFQSLNPLFVMLLTPPLLAYWHRRAAAGADQAPLRRMACGALIVAGAYLLLAAAGLNAGAGATGWIWLVLFFLVLTVGELFILPTGLGLFARLAPRHLGSTTVAAWFLVTFTGSLSAGLVGGLWSRFTPAAFFTLLALFSAIAAGLLWRLNGPMQHAASLQPSMLEPSKR